jgi:hypothetical protein
MNMAFYDSFSWFQWLLVLLIIVFLLIIIKNVYRLIKRRNEYLSYKEAKAQHQEHLQSKAKATDAQFEESEKESEEHN